MAGPGDGKAAAAVGRARVRASHTGREQVIDMLKAAFVQGRLAKDEFDARIGQALTCRTCAELAALTCDLPAGLAGGPVRELPRWRVSNAVRWGMSGFVTPAVLAVAFAFGSLRGGGPYEAAAFVIAFVYFVFWLSVGAGLLWEWHCASLPAARMCVRCAHTAASHRAAGSCAVRLGSLQLRGRCPCAGYVPPGLSPETADLDRLAATGYDRMIAARPACLSTAHRAVRAPAHTADRVRQGLRRCRPQQAFRRCCHPRWTGLHTRRLHGGKPPPQTPDPTLGPAVAAGQGDVTLFCPGLPSGTIGRWTPQAASADGQPGSSLPAPDAEAQAASQIMLAEYAALRTEVDRRASIQWNVLALQLTSAGVIASLAISRATGIALLLVIPLSSYVLGSRYILHDFHLKLISRYIRDSLSGRLQGHLAWESWKISQMTEAGPRGWLTPTAWNLLHPTRLAFEGVAWLALLTAALAAAYSWRDNTPAWRLILGFALLWILGALGTHFLHRSFNRSAGT